MKVVFSGDPSFSDKWKDLWSDSTFQHPLAAAWDIPYQKEYYSGLAELEDISFIIETQNTPVLGLMAFLEKSKDKVRLSKAGRPVVYLETRKRPQHIDAAFSLFKDTFRKIVGDWPGMRAIFLDYLNEGKISRFTSLLFELGAKPSPYFTQMIDLSKDEKALWSQTRVSYRSLINWGMRELNPQVYDSSNVRPEHMAHLRELHIKAAGRETRSAKTWDLQYEWVKQGNAFLVLGELEGRCVTGALFELTPHLGYYGVSASDRDLFEKPLAHAVLWKGVAHCKAIGCRYLETGFQIFTPEQMTYILDQLPTTDGREKVAQKYKNISTFKRGFGGDTHCWIDVTLEVANR